jgi:GNAT superfamily N-acetyltransferase
MAQEQASFKNQVQILVRSFEWEDWETMWKLNGYRLAEHGIIVDGPILPPDFSIVYDETNPNYHEMDMERIDEAYLKARGNFWIAWMEDQPVGFVGAQDKGDYIELRNMYVRKEYRRHGVGTLLVQALINHCEKQKVGVVKLWTANAGPGRFLYARLGFRQVALQGDEANTKYATGGEIRMSLGLTDFIK